MQIYPLNFFSFKSVNCPRRYRTAHALLRKSVPKHLGTKRSDLQFLAAKAIPTQSGLRAFACTAVNYGLFPPGP